ncbi:lasso peptide biosynthesis B2 protein [Sphingomonas cannabina]|uniref:lasso peptide biosynthesis B2 protein n=1 Tax=Sphingomonas cannabina TaxID=2899123 RepID=UPI001F4026C1|nr:lasso peptide biosynthesis B2 protein [Sphingomonas cannabina]UIJ46187.1 lasso peptide biosynthesis B2 protein [Sphingomonas cannabina]
MIEACLTLAAASLLVKCLPFRRIARLAAHPPAGRAPVDRKQAADTVAWAVRAAAKRARFRAVCIEQGLAAQWMLRRRGIAATMHYGVAQDPARGLIAHVWVRIGEHDVIGGETAGRFTPLARFPDAPPLPG